MGLRELLSADEQRELIVALTIRQGSQRFATGAMLLNSVLETAQVVVERYPSRGKLEAIDHKILAAHKRHPDELLIVADNVVAWINEGERPERWTER